MGGTRFGIVIMAAALSTGATPAAPSAAESQIVNSVGFVRGMIDGQGPYWFLIDTGANRSALDDDVVKALDLEVFGNSEVEGSAGVIRVGTTRIKRLRAVGLDVRNLAPTVSDLSGSLAPSGTTLAGILGFDAMRGHALHYDRTAGRIAFTRRADRVARIDRATIVPFSLDNNIPLVLAEVDGATVPLRLDTGASIGDGSATFVNVTQQFYDQLRTANPSLKPYTHFTATGTGGEIRIAVVMGRSLKIGRVEVPEPRMIVQPPVGYFARRDAVGFLGAYSLNRWHGFVVDYPRRRLLLLN